MTRAGGGLGRAIFLALAAHGSRVVLTGRHQRTLDATLALAQERRGDRRDEEVDVAEKASVARLVDRLEDEVVSILINNAGVPGPVKLLLEIEPHEWDDVFAVNVRRAHLMCRAFLLAMVAGGSGDVLNLASLSGKRPLAGRTPYCASKTAVIGLSMTLGAEVGPAGVRVNTLPPGPVRGPRMDRNFPMEAERTGVAVADAERAFTSRAARGRLLEDSKVADAVIAMLPMTGLHCADIGLSAGMVGR